MPTGRLGIADLTANTLTTLYTCPSQTFTVASVSVCNRNSTDVTFRMAISESDTPTNAEYIEFDVLLTPNGVLERTSLVLDAGKKIVVRSNNDDVSVVAFGIETTTV
jgi:hypothetical protein